MHTHLSWRARIVRAADLAGRRFGTVLAATAIVTGSVVAVSGTPAAAASGACPAAGKLTQGFHEGHNGIDIANAKGTEIYAVMGGEVIASASGVQGYGQWIRIRHADGAITEYGHMYERHVAKGQQVSTGQRIALMGREGDSTGVHLHLRTFKPGEAKGSDPIPFLRDRGVSIPCTPGGGGGEGGVTNVTAWAEANVRACSKTSCDVKSKVYANETYPAVCYEVGQRVTAEGITNDKWVKLKLKAGGHGFVSAIYLRGNETGGVPNRC